MPVTPIKPWSTDELIAALRQRCERDVVAMQLLDYLEQALTEDGAS